jgi:hypothetical protein
MGVVNTTYTFTGTDTITSSKLNNIIDDTTFTSDAISGSSLQIVSPGKLAVAASGITSNELANNSVTSAKIVDGTIVNADINASAAISGTKIAPSFGNQNIRQDGGNARIFQYNQNAVAVTDFGIAAGTGSSEGIGLYNLTSTGVVSFGTNSTERMRITASGNVGVGTTSPSYKLDVNGDIKSRSGWILGSRGTSGFTGLSTAENTFSGGCIIVRDDNSTYNTHGVEFYANSTEQMRIQSNGNVGIGTTNPSTKLQVNGTVTATAFSGPLTGNVNGNASSASTVSNSAITAAKLDGNQSGSAPIFGARAWVNFNGTGTIAIRNSGNVSSLSDNSVGNYSVNFATAMSDANFSTVVTSGRDSSNNDLLQTIVQPGSGAGVQVLLSQTNTSTTRDDSNVVCVSVFR